ncbi:hypothetical protein J14TS2_17620 [Bacillus sp. J14TS2]|uniref:hypothetical protein n=1 Tax=Bacillus sp. J14TS2 TaxID=2807188 RepID=UPI001B06005D|nr:hypothetical protein [Bacillus sp. J14TS2]GIN71287.1 hypothetical protein J14TS2_17620 [Bacillus sp. J14TS2]
MLESLRRQLWETIYLNPVTIDELLENKEDEGYKEIDVIEEEHGVTVKLTFWDDEDLITSTYEFNAENFLQKALIIERQSETIIFDRNKRITELLKEIEFVKNQGMCKVNILTA